MKVVSIGTSRHFGAAQLLGGFRSEADINLGEGHRTGFMSPRPKIGSPSSRTSSSGSRLTPLSPGTPPVLALMRATSSIPIVFVAVGDPIANGLVKSLARPGGNVTGLSNLTRDLAGKRVEILREAIPGLRRLAILANVANMSVVLEMRDAQAAARTLGYEVITMEIRQAEDIAPAFETLGDRADALYIVIDGLVFTNRATINALALNARLPTMHGGRESVAAGGLTSYGPNFPELFRRAADYIDKILRGAKPADIPVEQPAKFDLVINLKTAKALGLTVPPPMLARADDVIE